MSVLRELFARLAGVVGHAPPRASDAEIMRELESDLAMQIAENERRGMAPEEARRQALIGSGGMLQAAESVREQRGLPWFETLWQDLAYAFRSLKRSSGLTAGVVFTLALGLGVNMAMFSFLDVVFLRYPAGVREPTQVKRVWNEIKFMTGPQFWSGYSYPEYETVRAALGERVATTVYQHPRDRRIGPPHNESMARTSFVAASYFPLLGVTAATGRFFTQDEDRLGAGAKVVVASHAFWRSRLGGDANAIGTDILIAGQPHILLGVAAEGFSGVELDATDLWVPIATQPSGRVPWWQSENVNGFQILFRPAAGENVGDEALVQRIAVGLRAHNLRQRTPRDTNTAVALGSVIRAQGPGTKVQEVKIATRLAGVTAIVLIIACANVINLLLARAVRRRREIAVRLAMGISRIRLARLLLSETVLLALAAAVAAVLCAYWGGELLRGLLMPDVKWASGASTLHWRVVALALAAGMGAGIVAGILPALQSIRTDLTDALKAGGSSDIHSRGSRARAAIVVAQAALSVVLLVGTGLFVSSLSNIRGLRTGYDAPQILIGEVTHDTRDSLRDAQAPRRLREVAGRMRRAPGVEAAALSRMAPTRGFSTLTYHPDVDTLQYKKLFATFNPVTPEFFETMGLRMLRGDALPRVTGSATPPVVVINEQMAKAQWPGREPIGRCLRFETDPTCYRIIGVVETAMFDKLLEQPVAQYYVPLDRMPAGTGSWVSAVIVRARSGARAAATAELRQAIRETFPGGRPTINTLEAFLEPQYRPWRLGAILFAAFGILALIVAAVGIYSTVSYAVAQRTQEFGIRAALGAQARDILGQVVGDNLRIVSVGVAIGIALALAGGRLIASLLYGIEPGDPGVMAVVAVALLVIATLAALAPAWRAARVNPTVALRSE